MHCPYCGSELENDAKFCTSCGKAIPAGAAPAPEAPAEPVAPAAPVDDGPKTDSRQSYSQTANNGGGVLPFDQFFKTLITAVAKPVTGVIEE